MINQNVCQLNVLVMWLLAAFSIGFVACDVMWSNNEFGSRYEKNKINKAALENEEWNQLISDENNDRQLKRTILFKGVWLRNKHKQRPDLRLDSGHFFRSNSNENEPEGPFINPTSRDKRAAPKKGRKRNDKIGNNLSKQLDSNTSFVNIFSVEKKNKKNMDISNLLNKMTNDILPSVKNDTSELLEKQFNEDSMSFMEDIFVKSEGNATAKRSMKYDELTVDRIDLLDMFNKSKYTKAHNETLKVLSPTILVHDKNEMFTPIPTVESITKPINEKGLIKVLSMLTKTFKKIMKQHHSIKMIHEAMSTVNKEFADKINVTAKKLDDFDVKYTSVMKLIDKLSNYQDCLKKKEEMFKKKDEVMTKNIRDFENQQNKFLAQQQQFYNIQKMMLVQNEKINEKQNTIAKMQNEISHRQNHFAKLLKQAKYGTSKNNPQPSKDVSPKIKIEKNATAKIKSLTTERPTAIEPVKINLLSLTSNNVIEDQDQMILQEKDDKSVDDLIYKYYFNNTFLDTMIRNKILGGAFVGDKTSLARRSKFTAKRFNQKSVNDTKVQTTLLFPVNKTSKRERRWINHHSTKKHRRRHHSKGHPVQYTPKHESIFKTEAPQPQKIVKESDMATKDPFLAMATKFCLEIGQNGTKQILDWCVEKAIRRLSPLDRNIMVHAAVQPKVTAKPTPPPAAKVTIPVNKVTIPVKKVTNPVTKVMMTSYKPSNLPVHIPASEKIVIKPVPLYIESQFFPDNQELEQNLKQFDLTPDTAGNVYFEGSLHASDFGDQPSDGVSDVLPGYDSDSKVDLDPRLIQMHLRKKHFPTRIQQKKLWRNPRANYFFTLTPDISG